MEFLTGLREKVNDILVSALVVQSSEVHERLVQATPAQAPDDDEEMYSCESMRSAEVEKKPEQPIPQAEPLVTAATSEMYSQVSREEIGGFQETAFLIRNLTTGESIDLRDENDPMFAQKYSQLLTLTPSHSHVDTYL